MAFRWEKVEDGGGGLGVVRLRVVRLREASWSRGHVQGSGLFLVESPWSVSSSPSSLGHPGLHLGQNEHLIIGIWLRTFESSPRLLVESTWGLIDARVGMKRVI
jgi:hypothetical protein